jgi:signal transduction histidine kinase
MPTANVRIERILRRLALWIGILVAIAVPAGYGTIAYVDQLKLQALAAQFTARQIARYAYVQGETWRYSNHRVGEIVELYAIEEASSQRYVYDISGDTVVSTGRPQAWPIIRVEAPIIAGAEHVGSVALETSLRPLLLRTLLLGLLGVALGLSAFGSVHLATTALRRAADDLNQQYAETEAARQAEEFQRRSAEGASRSKSEFLANMSHELRTPLNAVIGFSDLMQQKMMGPLSDVYASYAADINTSGRHLLSVINDILDLAKVESGQATMAGEYCDLAEIFETCLRLTELRAQKQGVALVANLDLPPGEEMGTLDPTRTKQIVLNLLSNAVKFTPRGGSVTLDVTRPEASLLKIRVNDTGIGMTPAEIAIAFEPFRQVSNTLTRHFEGTGLGLPISRKFAELQGGSLTLDSAPGQGTTVTVLLPVGGHHAEQAA